MKKSSPTIEPFLFKTPRLYPELRAALIEDDVCPNCLGDLDTTKECADCLFDAMEELRREEG